MAGLSGLRGITEVIAMATGAAPGREWRDAGAGGPAARSPGRASSPGPDAVRGSVALPAGARGPA